MYNLTDLQETRGQPCPGFYGHRGRVPRLPHPPHRPKPPRDGRHRVGDGLRQGRPEILSQVGHHDQLFQV